MQSEVPHSAVFGLHAKMSACIKLVFLSEEVRCKFMMCVRLALTQPIVNRPAVFCCLDIGRDLVKNKIVLQAKRQI